MAPMKPTESPRQVDLGGGAPLSRLVVPLVLDRSDDRGAAIATRLAERWDLPIHFAPLTRLDPDAIDLTGNQPDSVAEFAAQLRPGDLVVMGTDQPVADQPTMSFAQAMTHEWDGPIVMVGPNARLDASLEGDVVAATDGSGSAARETQTGALLAAALGSHLRLIRVVGSGSLAGTRRLGARRKWTPDSAYALDLTQPIDLRDVSWHVVYTDDAASTLAAYVDRHDAAFLAISSPDMFALVRPRFGTICMAAVQACPRPVIVARPSDF